MGLTNWASRSANLVRNLCGSFSDERTSPQINHQSPHADHNPPNTLEALIVGGWPITPPGPQEAGPSNWVGRAHERAVNELYGSYEPENTTQEFIPLSESSNEPTELRNISNLINQRFRLSPPLFADTFNPMLLQNNQLGHSDEDYSPTSPLDINLSMDVSPPSTESITNHHQNVNPRQVVLGIPVTASMFTGKRRRDAPSAQSQSFDSFFKFDGDEFQARFIRQKKKLEDWDAKGGFNVVGRHKNDRVRSKAITDIEMATAFGVELDGFIRHSKSGKRLAAASPNQHISYWNQKKNKKCSTPPMLDTPDHDTTGSDMLVHLSLAIGRSSNESVREVVDPNQPPKSS